MPDETALKVMDTIMNPPRDPVLAGSVGAILPPFPGVVAPGYKDVRASPFFIDETISMNKTAAMSGLRPSSSMRPST